MTQVIDWNAVDRQILASKRVKSGIRAEELRDKIDPEPLIAGLIALVKEADTVAIEDLPRLQFKAQTINMILKKVMPDLRSLEVTEKDNKHSTLIIQMEPNAVGDGQAN